MSYHVDSFVCPEGWSKDATRIVEWVKNKSNESLRQRLSTDDKIIEYVLQLIVKQDTYGGSNTSEVLDDETIDWRVKDHQGVRKAIEACLEFPRADARFCIDAILAANNVQLDELYDDFYRLQFQEYRKSEERSVSTFAKLFQ